MTLPPLTQPLFAQVEADVVRVALPLPADELFEYAVTPALAGRAQPGCRVRVRLRERTLVGVVVERGASAALAGRRRPVEAVLDPEPVISPTLLGVLREAAADALCPVGLALAAALPAGSAPRVSQALALSSRGRAALASGALRGPAASLLARLSGGPRTRAELRRLAADPALLEDLLADGLLAAAALERGPAARAARVAVARLAAGVDVEAEAAGGLARAPRQAALLRRLARAGPAPLPSLRREFPQAPALLRQLALRGLVCVRDEPAPRDVLGAPLHAEPPVTLTAPQAAALAPVLDAVRLRRAERFLLHGVTGSGKTEVYLRAVAAALAAGRQALVLVPEITLTHQILARLRARFGDAALAVLHSGLRPGERVEQWQRLRAGATPIAVGARSALFAPLDDLGVIVIDEEHDGAYKNEEGFRYHARDLAQRRARAAGCPLLLGSATPSLETRFAADRGEVRRLVLAERIGRRPLPAVEIVDLQRERELSPRGRRIVLSRALARAMQETLAAGGQTILLLNRRGFSTQIFCFACGHAEHCPHCDIALVYHAALQALCCHYCDHRIPPPEACSGCGNPETALLGLGTERLEEEVRTRFPEARVARLDRDTAQRRGHTAAVLRGLRERRIDVLVGTQMVAKGHDFPGVRLVGVVLADVGLHLPDFRAAERTFQLLTQVAGRAGRALEPGLVVIQTWAKDHYAIEPVRRHDYEAFYAKELDCRRALGYPPFSGLVHALVSGVDQARALEAARGLAAAAGPRAGVELLGPAPAPLARLRGRYRFQLLAKSADADALRGVALRLRAAADRLPEGLAATVDPHPFQML
jgi:primosomal protein N' (replication factor Y)